jgi:dihydrofolate reductase
MYKNSVSGKEIPVIIVAAMSKKRRALGKGERLLWRLPKDLARFKALTLGHPLIMGRKTHEAILRLRKRTLPERRNIVLSRTIGCAADGAEVASSLEEALAAAAAAAPAEIHIGGGGELYRQALPFVDRLFLTLVEDEPEADVFFPPLTNDFIASKEYEPRVENGICYRWVDYERRADE